MHKCKCIAALWLMVGLCVSVSYANEIVGINFIGSAGSEGTLGSGDYAGLTGSEGGNTIGSTLAANWNNLSSNSGSALTLYDNSGAVASGLTVLWSSYNVHAIPDVTSGSNLSGEANPTMMKGYLDNGDEGNVTVSLSGISYESYSVIVYTDGDNGELWRRSSITLNDGSSYNTIIEDSENVNFNSGSSNNANGLFQLPVDGGVGNQDWPFSPNNSEGNIVIFTGLTGSSFDLTAAIETYDGEFGRSPINAIQIVDVPEPMTMTLVLVGSGFYLLRRKRS